MKPNKILFFTLLLSVTNTLLASELYQWVDENGVINFTQKPPTQGTAKKIEVQDMENTTNQISPLPVTQGGQFDYCGTRRLPGSTDKPLLRLANIRPNLQGWKQHLETLNQQRTSLIEQQLEINRSPNKAGDLSRGIKQTEQKIAELACVLRWAKQQVKLLEPERQTYFKKLAQVQGEYDAIKHECGKKPDISGWTDDETAKAWASCQGNRSRIRRHNKKLQELKGLKNLLPVLE
ncbi:DUF4124 domain-containing protein [Candidatus Venteria ishoeyi]|uniref:DUF4124 domain-containing protein n=1 Tax=Candidatus Venteria ishoeyi TaxID=1899563 RepID=UPI0025A58C74|nr:DUF4124 domain-containing protein [Candidatus Venteria ishoeyi]MDM8545654.1 DUF4124 domain-containing protein [Candidatus Venteria ishoeyi]